MIKAEEFWNFRIDWWLSRLWLVPLLHWSSVLCWLVFSYLVLSLFTLCFVASSFRLSCLFTLSPLILSALSHLCFSSVFFPLLLCFFLLVLVYLTFSLFNYFTSFSFLVFTYLLTLLLYNPLFSTLLYSLFLIASHLDSTSPFSTCPFLHEHLFFSALRYWSLHFCSLIITSSFSFVSLPSVLSFSKG